MELFWAGNYTQVKRGVRRKQVELTGIKKGKIRVLTQASVTKWNNSKTILLHKNIYASGLEINFFHHKQNFAS